MGARRLLIGLCSIAVAILFLLRWPGETIAPGLPTAEPRPSADALPGQELPARVEHDFQRVAESAIAATETTTTLALSIVDAHSGLAVSGPSVAILRRGSGDPYWLMTGGKCDGTWEQAVPAGETLELRIQGPRHRERDVRLPAVEEGSRHAETIELDPYPLAEAVVHVVDAIGRGVAGARISLHGENEQEHPAISGPGGEATLSFFDDGNGRFGGTVEADGFATRTFHARRGRDGELIIEPDLPLARPGTIALDTALAVSGKVEDTLGRAVAGASIRVSTFSSRISDTFGGSRFAGPWNATTAEDGSYRIAGIPYGVALFWYVEGARGECAAEEGLALVPPADGLDWTLAPPVRVTGVVRGVDGLPLSDAHVNLVRPWPSEQWLPPPACDAHAQGVTDRSGAFELTEGHLGGTGIPWGRYAILAWKDPEQEEEAMLEARQWIDLPAGEVLVIVDLVATAVSQEEERPASRRELVLSRTRSSWIPPDSNLASILAFGRDAAPFLEEALRERAHRMDAVDALRLMAPELAVPILIRGFAEWKLGDTTDEAHRQELVIAIGSLGGAEALAFLVAERARVANPESDLAILLDWAIPEARGGAAERR